MSDHPHKRRGPIGVATDLVKNEPAFVGLLIALAILYGLLSLAEIF